MEAQIVSKTVKYGRQRWKLCENGAWMVLMFGSHGPNDPPVGLSWKWIRISKDRVPDEVQMSVK